MGVDGFLLSLGAGVTTGVDSGVGVLTALGSGVAVALAPALGVGVFPLPPRIICVGVGGNVGMGHGVGVIMLYLDAPTDSAQSC